MDHIDIRQRALADYQRLQLALAAMVKDEADNVVGIAMISADLRKALSYLQSVELNPHILRRQLENLNGPN